MTGDSINTEILRNCYLLTIADPWFVFQLPEIDLRLWNWNENKMMTKLSTHMLSVYTYAECIRWFMQLTWMPWSCCQSFAHAHRTWHRCTVPMCNNIVHRMRPFHLEDRRRLAVQPDFRYGPWRCRHDSDQLSKHMDTFAVKVFAGTAKMKRKEKWQMSDLGRIYPIWNVDTSVIRQLNRNFPYRNIYYDSKESTLFLFLAWKIVRRERSHVSHVSRRHRRRWKAQNMYTKIGA